MDLRNFIGSGLRDAKIRNSAGTLIDVYGVVQAEGSPQRESTEVRGDDMLLGVFNSSLREDFTLQANGLSFDVVQAITGNTSASSATGSKIAIGTDSELSAPFVEVRAYTVAKTKSGANAYIQKTWYKVQFNNVSVVQQGEQEFQVTMEGTAYQTDVDVTGATLADGKCVATLEARSGSYTG